MMPARSAELKLVERQGGPGLGCRLLPTRCPKASVVADHGLSSRILLRTSAGLLLVAAMVVSSVERERILRRYSHIIGALGGWE